MANIRSTKVFLKGFGVVIGCFLIFFFVCVFFKYDYISFPKQSEKTILIKNVNIIDVEIDSVLLNHNILIINGIIKSISNKPVSIKENAIKIIDGKNKYVISGMWDMHVHLSKQSPFIEYPEFIRNGITHVRDMRGSSDDRDPFAGVMTKLSSWNKLVKNQVLIGPELHSYSSFAVDGPNPMFKGSPKYFNCSTPEDAIKLVKHFKEKNISLIKIYDNIPPDAFLKLMEEATKLKINVAGHKPVRVSTVEASNAGMKSMEHARFFIWDSYKESEKIRRSMAPKSLDNTELRKQMLLKHDTVLLKQMFNAFVKNNTFYCPTHITRKADAFAGDSLFRQKYDHINPILRMLSFEDLNATIQEDPSAEGRKVYKDFYLKGLEISGKASKYGVKILAGSDVPELPGSSLHEELKELSLAGLPPYEVLRTTTLYPAKYYGISNRYGSIKEGKIADLVILSKNPIDDIQNIQKIEGIISNGTFLNSNFLESVEIEIKKRRTGIIMTTKLIWDVLIYMTL